MPALTPEERTRQLSQSFDHNFKSKSPATMAKPTPLTWPIFFALISVVLLAQHVSAKAMSGEDFSPAAIAEMSVPELEEAVRV